MKIVDEYVGSAIALLLLPLRMIRRRKSKLHPRKILVIKFWGIGSVTLTTPFLRHLKKIWPQCEIHYLSLQSNGELCSLISEIDAVHTISITSLFSFFKTTAKTVRALRLQRFDVVYDLEFFTNVSAIVGMMTGAGERVGFVDPRRRFDVRKLLYTRCVRFLDKEHAARNFIRQIDPDAPILFPGFHRPYLQIPTVENSFSVIFNINASQLAYERRWTLEGFRHLALHLIDRFGVHIFLTGAKEEIDYVGRFAETLGRANSVSNLCGKLTMSEFVDLMGATRLVVTNDSGPLHIASALNVPTICFFGPETPQRYGSLSDQSLTFYKGLWCSPCMTLSNLKTVNCVNNMECMKQILFMEIRDKVDQFVRSVMGLHEKIAEEQIEQIKI